MNEKEIYSKILDWLKDKKDVAIASVIETWGSSPRPVGSIMAINNNNEIFTLISKESLNDYQQRKNINTNTNDELLLLKILFENLALTFEQFHNFLVSSNIKS